MHGCLKLFGVLAISSALSLISNSPAIAQGVDGMTDKERFDRPRNYLTSAVNGQGQLRESARRQVGGVASGLSESYERTRTYHDFVISDSCSASLSYTINGRHQIWDGRAREAKGVFQRNEGRTDRWHFGSMTEATTSEAEGQYVLWIRVPTTFSDWVSMHEGRWARSLNISLREPEWGRRNNPPKGDDDVKIRFRDSITRDNAKRAADFIQSYCKGKDPNVMEF